MAKKKQKSGGEGHKPTTALANVESSGKLAVELMAKADVGVSTQDVVAIAVAEFERRVRKQIEIGSKRVKELKKELDEAESRFKTAVTDFLQNEYQHPAIEAARVFYMAMNLAFDHCREVHIVMPANSTAHVTVTIVFYSAKSQQISNTWNSVTRQYENGFSYQDEFKFSKSVPLAVCDAGDLWSAVPLARERLATATRLQSEWMTRLTQLAGVERQARARLAANMLKQSEGGRELYESIMAQFEDDFLQDAETFDG